MWAAAVCVPAVSTDGDEKIREEKSNFYRKKPGMLVTGRFIRLIGLYMGVRLIVLVLQATNRSLHSKLLLVTVMRSMDIQRKERSGE